MTQNTKIKVSIIGVTGFTGAELLRVLLPHPHVEFAHLVSRQYENEPLVNIFPRLGNSVSHLTVSNVDHDTVAADSDVVFLCLPHVASQEVIDSFLGKTKVIDMSADFRLDDAAIYEKYYGVAHKRPDLLNGRFVYGLPELHREEIKKADAVANIGCNAFCVQMMLLPFAGKIDHVDVSLFTGTSGGGRSKRDPVDHPVLAQNVRSYQVNCHRHTPEIIRTAKITEDQFNFTPTVGPFLRGIWATAFIRTSAKPDLSCFDNEPFIRVREKVELTNVVSNNYCDISVQEGVPGTYIVQGAIDNILRGSSGTALQNMNLMFGLDEATGLTFNTAIYP